MTTPTPAAPPNPTMQEALEAADTLIDYLKTNDDGFTREITAEWLTTVREMGGTFSAMLEYDKKSRAEICAEICDGICAEIRDKIRDKIEAMLAAAEPAPNSLVVILQACEERLAAAHYVHGIALRVVEWPALGLDVDENAS